MNVAPSSDASSPRAALAACPAVFLGLCLFFLLPGPASGQEWGDFTREELFSRHFPEAPGADAVILYDHGTLRVDEDHRLKVIHHRRTKIFTEAGTSRGVVRIPLRHGEELKNFRGHTIVPPGQEKKVGGRHMSEESTPDGRVRIVRFPDVAPGVILEYEYEVRTDELRAIDPWPFQREDFVRRADLDLQLPLAMSYDAFFGWTSGAPPKPKKKTINHPENPNRQLHQASWRLSDLEPLAEVAFVRNVEDYRTTLFVQLQAFRAGGESETTKNVSLEELQRHARADGPRSATFARSWSELAADADARFRAFFAKPGGASPWASAVVAGASSEREKAQALFALVQAEIELGSGESVGGTVADVVQSRRGTAIERNLLLAHLLRSEGIAVDPLLVSTQDRGSFRPRYRNAAQLDHVILRATLGGDAVLLDTSNRFCPFGALPPRTHGTAAVLVSARGGELVPLEIPAVHSSRDIQTAASLDESGELTCRSKITFTGFEAMEARARIADQGPEAFANGLLEPKLGEVAVESVESANGAAETPLVLLVDYRVPGFAQSDGYDLACAFPFAFVPPANPFPAGARRVPIEFAYPSTWDEVVHFTMPDGYRLQGGLPKAKRSLEELSFQIVSEVDGSKLKAKRRFAVSETTVDERRYGAVREFYDELLGAHEGRLVLKSPPMHSASSG